MAALTDAQRKKMAAASDARIAARAAEKKAAPPPAPKTAPRTDDDDRSEPMGGTIMKQDLSLKGLKKTMVSRRERMDRASGFQ